MRNKIALTRALRGLVDLVEAEASQNAQFAAKLDDLLESMVGKKDSPSKKLKVDASSGLPDVHAELALRGDAEFRLWLQDLPLPILRQIIRKHDLDSGGRTAKWKEAEKLAAYVADRLKARAERGSSFMRSGGEGAD